MIWLVTCLYGSVFASVVGAKELYDVLDVTKDASPEEIKHAYKRLARQWHPDKNKSPEASEKFMEINAAYEILSDRIKRFRYDHFSEPVFHRSERSDFKSKSTSWGLSYMLLPIAFVIIAANYLLQAKPIPSKQTISDVTSGVPQLTRTKMDRMILNPPVGRLCIVMMVTTRETQIDSIRAFEQAVKPYVKDERLCFTWLATYENSDWLVMIQTATGDLSEVESPSNGSIVAINGRKSYFSILSGVNLDRNNQASNNAFEDTFQFFVAGGVDGSVIDRYCSDVCVWLDRLLDGTLPRYHVDQWPDIVENET